MFRDFRVVVHGTRVHGTVLDLDLPAGSDSATCFDSQGERHGVPFPVGVRRAVIESAFNIITITRNRREFTVATSRKRRRS